MRSLVHTLVPVIALSAVTASTTGQIQVASNTVARDLADAILSGGGGGLTINNATLAGHSNGGLSSTGVFLAGVNNYGLSGAGAVLSTGVATDYASGPNTTDDFGYNWGLPGYSNLSNPGVAATAGQEALLDPITGGLFAHYDVTQLTIEFTPDVDVTGILFDVVFGSEEYFEFVGSDFIDGFGIYLNGVNIAFTPNGPVNINHPGAAILETQLDGVSTFNGSPLLSFGGAVNPLQVNTLTFIIADTTDGIYDSTVYVQGLGVPAPGAMAVLAMAGLFAPRRRRAG
jgi:hypothetical protein